MSKKPTPLCKPAIKTRFDDSYVNFFYFKSPFT